MGDFTLQQKDLSNWKEFYITFKEKGFFSHLPASHLRIPRLTVNLRNGKHKLGNASLLTHRRHWLELNNEEKQELEHPTEPKRATTQGTEAWKSLYRLWLLQPSSQWSFWVQAFRRASVIALLGVYQRKKLKERGLQLQPWPPQSSSGPYWQQGCTHWSILFFGLDLLLFSALSALQWHLHYLIQRRILTRDTRTSRRDGKEEQMGASYLCSLHKSHSRAASRQKTPAKEPQLQEMVAKGAALVLPSTDCTGVLGAELQWEHQSNWKPGVPQGNELFLGCTEALATPGQTTWALQPDY